MGEERRVDVYVNLSWGPGGEAPIKPVFKDAHEMSRSFRPFQRYLDGFQVVFCSVPQCYTPKVGDTISGDWVGSLVLVVMVVLTARREGARLAQGGQQAGQRAGQ